MSFVERNITLTVTLGGGNFGDAGASNTAKLEGYRCTVNILKSNLPAGDSAEVRVWGIGQTLANQISRLGKPLSYDRKNILSIEVGDSVSGMSLLFSGLIWTAYQDFSDMPDVALVMTCNSGVQPYITPGAPFTYNGTIDAANIAATLATQMGLGFVNNGVSVQLSNPYLPGTPNEQFNRLMLAGNFYGVIDSTKNILTIWPKDAPNGQGAGVTIAPPNLVGYPEYSDTGIVVRSLFQPGLMIGETFTLETSITPAQGQWQVWTLRYDLAAQMPDGPWFMEIGASLPLTGQPQ